VTVEIGWETGGAPVVLRVIRLPGRAGWHVGARCEGEARGEDRVFARKADAIAWATIRRIDAEIDAGHAIADDDD